jgi:hypothetical protein
MRTMRTKAPRLSCPRTNLKRLAERFAKKILGDMFTPCEIVDYCQEYRGRPREAIKTFQKFVEDGSEGKDEYLYDVKDDQPRGKTSAQGRWLARLVGVLIWKLRSASC